MIDWHSHILPAMDDGSRDVTESLSMLHAMREQGVECVIATPHFYANDESVADFLNRRDEAYAALKANMQESTPRVLCGAEVKYYPGIGRMADLEQLTIGSTNLLLLEMSMSKWTEYTVKEILELASSRNLTIILAHIERYMSFQSAAVWERFLESGLLMQVNASFFYELRTKRKALKLLDEGGIHFIGSDCHNLTTRPPKLYRAYELIEKKFGKEFVSQMCEYGHDKLGSV